MALNVSYVVKHTAIELGNLNRHVSIIHTQNVEPLICIISGSTFKHKYYFRKHLRIKHKQLFKHYEATNSTYKKNRRQII